MILLTMSLSNSSIEKYEKMILSFLNRHYQVSRIKINSRFKRCIILDDGSIYLLNDKSQVNHLKFRLIDILKIVFNSDETTSKNILNDFIK